MNIHNRFLNIFTSKIARRFALVILVFGLLISIAISALAIYEKYQEDLSVLKKDLVQIEQSIKSSLAYNLWVLNIDALHILTNDLLLNKNIVYVSIFDENGKPLIEKGVKPKKHLIERTIPLYYQKDKQKIYIGKLYYIVTTQNIYNDIEKSALIAIVLLIIFFLLLSIGVLYFYWNTTVKHLLAIKEYAKKLRLGGYKEGIVDDLTLERKGNIQDEFDELVAAINDMHREIVEKYKAIEYQSLHDILTGLPNRRMIYTMIPTVIEQCNKKNGYSALLFLDIDQFKLINDSLGHTIGDKILIEISNRLKSVCSHMCQPARIAGDEFLVLLQRIYNDKEKAKESALQLAQEILKNISRPIGIDKGTIKVTASIGIAIFGAKSQREIVIKQADNALYRAKEKGRGQIAIFEPSMQKIADRRLHLEQLINITLEKDLIFMHYQPKYDSNLKIVSAEALVRVKDENGKIVSPAEFIPVAEESGLIIKIGDRIIEKVFGFINKNWRELKQTSLQSIAVNVSPTQYSAPGFVDKLIRYAKEFDIDPHFVVLEITEEVVASSIDTVLDVMNRLHKYGFKFSIDDFGTGYSSMRYLKNFPLSELKIDKSFIDDLLTDERTAAIVKTIIDMAHNLKLMVVAEGVENEKQFDVLRRYGCELYQGYFLSKPLPQEEFLQKLKSES